MATRKLDLYKLGVVLDVDGAKGLSTLTKTDKELKAVDHDARRAEGSLGKFASRLNRVTSVLKGNAGGAGGGSFLPGLANISQIIQGLPQIGQLAHALVSPLTEAASAGIEFNAFLETSELALKRHFGGSRDMARKFVGDVRDFAQKSLFSTEGLIKSVIYGTATGFSPKDALALIKDVGDAIASTGDLSEDMVQGVVRALSQMKAKGTVSAEEMEQLAERGIPAWEMLAHAIGKTVAETRKLSEQGKLSGVGAVEAMRAEMRARFGGTMKEMESSLSGRMASARDIIQSAQAKSMAGTTQNISDTLGMAIERGDAPARMAAMFDQMLTPVSGMIKASARGLLGGGLTEGLSEGIAAGKDLVTQTVTNFALDSVIGKFKSLFKINSPSLVMDGIGQSIGEGFENGAAASLDKAQKQIVKKIVEIGRKAGATADEIKAALATAWVESRFRNLNHGDRDSLGTFQQRPSQGWGTPEQIMNPDYAAGRFYAEARRRRGRGLLPGALAQSVQRSAYPERYAEALPFVNQVIQSLGVGSGVEPTQVRKAWEVLAEFARMRGFTVTSTTGGKHNAGSLHGRGLAVDIRTRDKSPEEVAELMAEARAAGIRVKDERNRPAGQKVWGGPHLHMSLPNGLISTSNPLPVMLMGGAGADFSAGNGGAFNPGAAPKVLEQARRELTRTIQDTGTVVVEVQDTAEQLIETTSNIVGVEHLTFKALIPLPEAIQDATVAFGHAAKTVISSTQDMGKKLTSALSGIGSLLPQQQVGKKRGFFSKLLGIASPFLGMIPGVGPLLSTIAGMGSAAAGGDWGSVLTQGVAGFSSGGVFRRTSSSPAPAPTSVKFINPATGKPVDGTRARGGPVSRGRAYLVGEHRAEVFTPDQDGFIHPSLESFSQKFSGGAGGQDGNFWREFREEITRLSGAVGNFDQKISSMPPEHVVSTVAKSHPQVFGDGLKLAASRDPKVVEWMQRSSGR